MLLGNESAVNETPRDIPAQMLMQLDGLLVPPPVPAAGWVLIPPLVPEVAALGWLLEIEDRFLGFFCCEPWFSDESTKNSN
ncbi:unnamed protein product [Urochloa humidicola]